MLYTKNRINIWSNIVFYGFLLLCVFRFVSIFITGNELSYTKYAFLLLAIPSSYLFLRAMSKINFLNIMTLLLISSMIITSLSQLAFDVNITDEHGRSTNEFIITNVLYNFIFVIIGAGISRINSIPVPRVILLSLLVSILLILITAADKTLVLNFHNSDNIAYDLEISHLTLGPYVSFILIVVSSAFHKFNRYIVYIICLIILFIMGSRADLFSFFVALNVIEIIRAESPLKVFKKIGLMVCFSTIVLVLYFEAYASIDIGRMGSFLDISKDNSFLARVYFLFNSFSDFPSQALYGGVSEYTKRFGGVGSYIHNLLSAWQFFGVFVFLLLIFQLYSMMKVAISKKSSEDNYFVSFLFIYSIINVLLFKSANYHLLWLSIGVFHGIQTKIKFVSSVNQRS